MEKKLKAILINITTEIPEARTMDDIYLVKALEEACSSILEALKCIRLAKAEDTAKEVIMNYYSLDFSGTNATAPTEQELDDLKRAGVEHTHDYGMSLSGAPDAPLDLFMNARTTKSVCDLEDTLEVLFKHPPRFTRADSQCITIRQQTVQEELNSVSNLICF